MKSESGFRFHSIHQFLVKWHFRKRKRSFYGQELIEEAVILTAPRGVHAAAADFSRRLSQPSTHLAD